MGFHVRCVISSGGLATAKQSYAIITVRYAAGRLRFSPLDRH
jgi:hypothetical protein